MGVLLVGPRSDKSIVDRPLHPAGDKPEATRRYPVVLTLGAMPGGARLVDGPCGRSTNPGPSGGQRAAATYRAERGFFAASLQLTSEPAVADIGLHTPD